MADAKGNFDWQQTSSIEAILINVNRSSKSKTIHPDELNPYTARKYKERVSGQFAWSMFKKLVKNSMK